MKIISNQSLQVNYLPDKAATRNSYGLRLVLECAREKKPLEMRGLSSVTQVIEKLGGESRESQSSCFNGS